MFSLKTILFAATAALAGVVSAVPVHTPGAANPDLVVRAPLPQGEGEARVYGGSDFIRRSPFFWVHASANASAKTQARSPRIEGDAVAGDVAGDHFYTERDACNSCGSIPGIIAYVNVQLDGILAHVRKWPVIPGTFLGKLAH